MKNSNIKKQNNNLFHFLLNDFFFYPITSTNKPLIINNNDTFQLILNIITMIKSTLTYINKIIYYNFIRLNFSIKTKIQIIIFSLFFLITFIYSQVLNEDDNSDIPDSLIFSAYFPNQKIVHITYENIIENNKIFNNEFPNPIENMDILNDKNIDFSYHNLHQEMYLFNFFPLKTGVFTGFSFLILYIFTLKTYTSKIKDSFIFNIFGLGITYLILNFLYQNKYYSASGLLFIQLSYFLKCLIETFFIRAKISRDDFEIFSSNLSANNFHQFISKFAILLSLTLSSGILIFGIYRVWINYIIFYLSIFTLVIFLSNCLTLFDLPSFLSPLKNLLIVILGFINFIISKFNRNNNNYKHQIYKEIKFNHKIRTLKSLIPDSLYLVSDFFTIFCFHYLNDFLKVQMNKYLKKQNHPNKKFTYDDYIWILGFIIGIGIGIIGMYKGEYMCYIISMYFIKIVMDIFSKVFNIKLVRIFNDCILLIFVFMNHIINCKGDNYLIDLFSSKEENRFIPKYICKILSLIQILCYMLMNFDYVYSQISDKNSDFDDFDELTQEFYFETKKKYNNRTKIQLQLIRPGWQFNIKTFFFINLEFYLNYVSICLIFYIMKFNEKSYVCLTIFSFILILFFARKFFIIREFKKDYEYLFSYILALIISMRLLVLTNNNSILLNYLCNLNILCLILFYSLINRRNNLVTFFILFHLYAGCLILDSNFLFIDFLFIVCLPFTFQLMKINNSEYNFIDEEINDNNGYTCVFIIPAIIVFSFELYGFKNVIYWMNAINQFFKRIFFGFDILKIFITLDNKKNKFYSEFSIIKNIIAIFLK